MGAHTRFWPERGTLLHLRRLLAIILVAALTAEWALPTLAATPEIAPPPSSVLEMQPADLPIADPPMLAGESLVRLPGHVLDALNNVKSLPSRPAADAEPIALTLVLKRSDQVGFDRYLRDVYDPRSPRFRHFLGQAELTERFGPAQQAYDAVLTYLQQSGFTLLQGSANRMTLTVRGTRGQAERAFSLHIRDYGVAGPQFFANDTDPAVPRHLASNIQAVAGLSSASGTPHGSGLNELAPVSQVVATLEGVLVNVFVRVFGPWVDVCAFLKIPPQQCVEAVAGAYLVVAIALVKVVKGILTSSPDPPPSIHPTGAGQKIGLLAFSSFRMSDVADWLTLSGLPAALINQVSQVHVSGGAPIGPDQTDVLLGIQTILALAPGAQVVVYDGPSGDAGTSFQTLFNTMINDGVTIISNSFSYCEDQTTLANVQSIDTILAAAAASGITVLNATGDTGSWCHNGSANTIAVPADSPHATAVGGTSPTVGPGFTYAGESWWDGANQIPPTGQGGFGTSRFFGRPAYQDGLNNLSMRSVPDIVTPADPHVVGIPLCVADAGGCPTGSVFAGTSLATPIWAASIALLNEALGYPLGFLNPSLYPLAGTDALHSAVSMGTDVAHVGLGSPNVNLLGLALAGTTAGPTDPSVSTVKAFSAVPFTPFFGSLPADGSTAASIIVLLRDANNAIVTGKNVVLSASPGGHAVITPSSGVSTAANGAVVFTVTNATVETTTFTATVDGVQLTETATVNFIGPPPATAGIAASLPSVAADGTASSTITVTLLDGQGHGTPAKQVRLSQGSGHSVITGMNPGVTDTTGRVQFTVASQVAGPVTYTATDETDGLPVPNSATVTFTGGSGPLCNPGALGPVGGAAFAFTNFVTGFPNSSENCVNPAGIAFDAAGNVYVSDYAGFSGQGGLYKFNPGGGTAGLSNRLNATPYPAGTCAAGLAFSKDGNHLYMARQFCGTGGDVVEVSTTDGSVLRTLATIPCATGLATDPISGDLFVSVPCPAPLGGLPPDNNIHRIFNPQSASPSVSVYSTPGGSAGLVFGPDGTLYTESYRFDLGTRFIAKIAATNSMNPGAVTYLATDTSNASAVLPLLNDPAHPSQPSVILTNGGNISAVDLTTVPAAEAIVFTGGTFGVVIAGGPDGCAYATQVDRIIRITAADGSCNFPSSNPLPALSLSPAAVTPSPSQGTPTAFTATFQNLSVPANTPVIFTVIGSNVQTHLARTDATGRATFTYAGVFPGTDAVLATATVSTQTLASNVAQVTWVGGPHTTFLTLNPSPTGGTLGQPVTLKASLTDVSVSPPVALANANVTFALGDLSCGGMTDNNGIVSCPVTPDTAGSSTLMASFAATAQYLGSTASTGFTTLAQVVPQVPSSLSYTGPTLLATGQPATLSAALTAGATKVSGRSVTFTLGAGAGAQTCAGTTDANGVARCAINPVIQSLGPDSVKATFAGDSSYLGSSATARATVFTFLPSGSFVIGDGNTGTGSSVTFWSNSWSKANTLSGGPAPTAFKGFAESVQGSLPACNDAWIASPGNSSTPPETVPAYMGVTASSAIGKQGSVITGNTVEVVVIKVDPGFSSNPGHPGSGTVLGAYCTTHR